MAIRIVLVDDHAIVLKGLHFFLATQKDLQIVGEAGNGRDAVQLTERLQPDVVLMDLVMPVMDGIEATRLIKQVLPLTKVIILTTFSDRDHVLPAIQAGANSYLLKDVEPESIADTIRKVYEDEVFLHPQIIKKLMHYMAQTTEPLRLHDERDRRDLQDQHESVESRDSRDTHDLRASRASSHSRAHNQHSNEDSLRGHGQHTENMAAPDDELTSREQEVLGLIATGKSNKELADVLAISEKTVKTHVSHILGKLGLTDRTQAAIYAIKAKLVKD